MLSLLIITYMAFTLMAFFWAERVIFQPPPASYAVGELPYRSIGVGDGDSIPVLHLPNDSARYTILFSHGNAEDLGHLHHMLRKLHSLGFGVLSYDYRGYGQSIGGRPTVRKAVEDAETIYQFAIRELEIDPDRLILHGRSVGSGPTMELATRHPVAGVILESAFTSTYRVFTRMPSSHSIDFSMHGV